MCVTCQIFGFLFLTCIFFPTIAPIYDCLDLSYPGMFAIGVYWGMFHGMACLGSLLYGTSDLVLVFVNTYLVVYKGYLCV